MRAALPLSVALSLTLFATATRLHAQPAPLPKKLATLETKRRSTGQGRAQREKWNRRLLALLGKKPQAIVNLRNGWTHEILALEARPKLLPDARTWSTFLRCHFTNQVRPMATKLAPVVVGAALHFRKDVVDIVSGYRAPKYNLMLRKKGREVARNSQHTGGDAVDFRIPGIGTTALLDHVRTLRLGGVGFYPESGFVHADTGPVRYWTGR